MSEDKIFHCPNCHEPSELMFYSHYEEAEDSAVYICGNCGSTEFEKNLKEVKEKYTDYDGEKPWGTINAPFKVVQEDSLLEEPPTYVDDRNISLEQSERKRLFSSGETFDIVIGKKEKQELKPYSIHCGVGIFYYHIEPDKIKGKKK